MRRPPMQGGQHIAQRGGLQAADDGYMPWRLRQWAFGFGGEQAFCFQLRLESEKALEQVTLAGPANRLDIELELAARFVKGNQRPRFDLLTVFQSPAEQLGTVAPHHAAYLGTAVLQRKIDVTGRSVGQVGNFATYPSEGKGGLQAIAHQAIEAGDTENGIGRRRGSGRHLWIVTRGGVGRFGVDSQ